MVIPLQDILLTMPCACPKNSYAISSLKNKILHFLHLLSLERLSTFFIFVAKLPDPVAQLDTCLPAGREQQSSMVFVYVLKSINQYRFYVGMTADVENRLKEHNAGRTKSTKGYRPWMLLFTEEFSTRTEARGREKYLKSGIGKEFIKQY